MTVEAPAMAGLILSGLLLGRAGAATPRGEHALRWFIVGNGAAANGVMLAWILARLAGAN